MIKAIQIFLMHVFGILGILFLTLALVVPNGSYGDYFLLVFILGAMNVLSLADKGS
jgi:hypothetical protein